MGEKPPLLPIFPRILGDYFLHYLWFYLPASAEFSNFAEQIYIIPFILLSCFPLSLKYYLVS
jgi:hypothetical protein